MATIRRPGAASAAVLVGLSISMVGAHMVAPKWSRRMGLDVWNFAAVEAEQRQVADERDEIESKGEGSARRRVLADQFAARLATRDADLATTAVIMRDLFREHPGSRLTLETMYPSVRDSRLLYARHTINRVERLLLNDPTQCETVLARLEAEYRELARVWTGEPQSQPVSSTGELTSH
ncbi:hypothetical protein J8F10_30290 [Gemmata sp. G18]|uniref:Periplasmic heavy metal sensor n=1 Tax=Gemmata palustris TaxID=2822762 RepID=A0ABS5C263_9BACT|nr:hypothetical protein [Gemmata palustris]MBP3959555.1 hypothetical protein [Gemmata palustris]